MPSPPVGVGLSGKPWFTYSIFTAFRVPFSQRRYWRINEFRAGRRHSGVAFAVGSGGRVKEPSQY